MKKWLISVVLVCLAAPVYAQCPGGQCPSPYGQRQPRNIESLPPVFGSQGAYGPVKQEGHLLSVVRIVGTASEGGRVKGSGTYVNYEGLFVVVTASHVVRGTTSLDVMFRGSQDALTVRGEVLSNDPVNDCAIIGLHQHPEDGEDIAASVAYASDVVNIKGEVLSNYGYGGDDRLCGGSGTIIGETGPGNGPNSWYEVSSRARLGDSGGPVFLPNKKLVGVLWGRDDRVIVIVKPTFVHVQLRSAKAKVSVEPTQVVQPRPLPRKPKSLVPVFPLNPPMLPWRDKIENEIDSIKKAPKCPPGGCPGQCPPSTPEVAPQPPVIDIEIGNPPVAPPVVEDERYKAPVGVAILIIVCMAIAGLIAGIAVQWKKTYSIK